MGTQWHEKPVSRIIKRVMRLEHADMHVCDESARMCLECRTDSETTMDARGTWVLVAPMAMRIMNCLASPCPSSVWMRKALPLAFTASSSAALVSLGTPCRSHATLT